MLEDFEKDTKPKINNVQFLNMIGIGVFLLLATFEVVEVITMLFRDILSIQNFNGKTVYLLPELLSPLIFGTIFYFGLCLAIKKEVLYSSSNTLIKSISVFFAIIILQFAYCFFFKETFISKYSAIYKLFYSGQMNQNQIHIYVSFIPISKHIIAALILLILSKKLMPK